MARRQRLVQIYIFWLLSRRFTGFGTNEGIE
jgi:hypothetical protein